MRHFSDCLRTTRELPHSQKLISFTAEILPLSRTHSRADFPSFLPPWLSRLKTFVVVSPSRTKSSTEIDHMNFPQRNGMGLFLPPFVAPGGLHFWQCQVWRFWGQFALEETVDMFFDCSGPFRVSNNILPVFLPTLQISAQTRCADKFTAYSPVSTTTAWRVSSMEREQNICALVLVPHDAVVVVAAE